MYHRFLENLHLSRVDQQIKWSVTSSSWIAGKQDCMRTIGVASKRMAMPSSCPKIVPNDLLPQSQNKNRHCYCTYSKNWAKGMSATFLGNDRAACHSTQTKANICCPLKKNGRESLLQFLLHRLRSVHQRQIADTCGIVLWSALLCNV